MRKTFSLAIEGKNRDRVLDAVKHEIRKYVKRERRRDLPAGADYWDFDCKVGLDSASAQAAHLASLIGLVDEAAAGNAAQVYVEILARPASRKPRPAPAAAGTAEQPQ